MEIIQIERDLGTPAPAQLSGEMVSLNIDGQDISVPAGTSIMRAAALLNRMIPKLCATDTLEPYGSCRLCLVEIEGKKGFPASCTTPVEQGMKVKTQSTRLQKLRHDVMELYISDHPLDCLTCAANGDCELQTMAGVTGLRQVRYGFAGENHLHDHKDESNPYFTYDPAKCIVCNRCVRACEETQGTFALTIDGRGFASRVAAGQNQPFFESECVSCGACVNACPTATLTEKSIIQWGQPEYSTITTCAYCGVGCNFKVETKGEQVVRMTPWKDGKANEGHACVKGRFAWGYATHKDRVTQPMLRNSIYEPWQEVSWEEAFAHIANKFKSIQAKYGKNAIGGITSSRCTNEEVFVMQKFMRAVLGTNNVDTCARVCHSPTGYGLGVTYGTSAGTQTFKSVESADVVVVMGANPTDAHPVFASRLKRRLREGAQLIVIDPRRIDLLEAPEVRNTHHLQLKPGSNVAILNAMAHTILSEGLEDKDFLAARCDSAAFEFWTQFILKAENSPEALESATGVPAAQVRAAARLYAQAGNAAIYYGLGVTEHVQGSTAVIGIANLAMLTGNIGREGVGVNPLRGQNNVQGSCDMGSFPHELSGYRHISDDGVRGQFEAEWGVTLDANPGLRIPNMFDAAVAGQFKGMYCQGEDIAQSDPNTQHVTEALSSLECLVVQDIFLNETAKYAHVFLPGASFLEKDGTFTNAERRINRVRKVMTPLSGKADWEVTQGLAQAMGFAMNYQHPSEIMDEIARLTPTFAGVNYAKLDQLGSVQWPCNDNTPAAGMALMHVDSFANGKGKFWVTQYIPTPEKVTPKFPLLLTTGRVLSQYNVGAQTRRTDNTAWYEQDVLEIYPEDAQERGITSGDWVSVTSRAGQIVLPAVVSERMQPGVVYTTFHFPESGANVITTENSDWATNCPEYKVTAVEVKREQQESPWQHDFKAFNQTQTEFWQQRKVKTGK